MQNKKTLIYGLHTIKTLLRQQPSAIQQLFLQEQRRDVALQELQQQAEAMAVAIKTLSKAQLDELTQGAVHQGVAAFCTSKENYHEVDLEQLLTDLEQPALLLILDGVQDPHNLGACLRSANALGAHAVIIPKDRAVGITPTVRKVASGAAELTPLITVTNLARTLQWLKKQGIWLYGADEEAAQKIYAVDFTSPSALILGAEGNGLRRLTRDSCDALVQIPTTGVISSLNVSVATGICLFEASRQRILAKA